MLHFQNILLIYKHVLKKTELIRNFAPKIKEEWLQTEHLRC
jgi:hypothetical protein